MVHRRLRITVCWLGTTVLFGLSGGQTTVTIRAGMDNTLYEENAGSLSNGRGGHFFSGKTGPRDGNRLRRGLIYFDVAGEIPAGATIQEVRLTLTCSRSAPESGNQSISVHRVTSGWGEGSSDAGGEEGQGAPATAGDATWIHRFYDTDSWTSPGGDFAASASASLDVGGEGPYSWGSTAGMVSDVQAWLDVPAENFGWMVIGNEGASKTAKRFDTRENGDALRHPTIEVTYDASSCVDCDPADGSPESFVLFGNFPNPFNPETTLRFDLADAAVVRLMIVNAKGQTVRTLLNCRKEAGSHAVGWNGRDGRERPAPSGFYYGILHVGTDVRTLKMLLMK